MIVWMMSWIGLWSAGLLSVQPLIQVLTPNLRKSTTQLLKLVQCECDLRTLEALNLCYKFVHSFYAVQRSVITVKYFIVVRTFVNIFLLLCVFKFNLSFSVSCMYP